MRRALEFYAGIGGLSRALLRCATDVQVVAAYDHDPSATAVYAHNYPSHPVYRTDISRVTAEEIAKHDACIWLLSPPCQPYTVLSPLAKGHADPRASSFHHLVFTIIPRLAEQGVHPSRILIENVTGFKDSVTREQTVQLLSALGYTYREFLLSPLQFQVPNSRQRYYLLAKLSPLQFTNTYWDSWNTFQTTDGQERAHQLLHFLDSEHGEVEADEYMVPDQVLLKWSHEFDIVLPSSRKTCCFTRGYTRLVQGSGSVLQQEIGLDTSATFHKFLESRNTGSADVEILRSLRLRYFTPSELLRLLCFFPAHVGEKPFKWPVQISTKTKYKLIGNSVNVVVVTHLLEYLFHES